MSNISQFQHYNNPQGLNGLFSWLGRAVKAVFNAAILVITPGNGYGITSAIIDFFDGNGSFGGIDNVGTTGWDIWGIYTGFAQRGGTSFIDLPLTSLDEFNLDKWLNNKFIPYYKNVLSQIKEFKDTSISLETFIAFYNEIQILIEYLDYLQFYSLQNPQSDLSLNAIKTRNALLNIKRTLLIEQIDILTASKGYSITTNNITKTVSTLKFNPLGFNNPTQISLTYKRMYSINNSIIDYGENVNIDNSGNNTDIPTHKNGKSKGVLGALALLISGYAVIKLMDNE